MPAQTIRSIRIADRSATPGRLAESGVPSSENVLVFGETLVELNPQEAGGRRMEFTDQEILCLVTQKGRTFQNEHPEIPVVLDHGRYLLVRIVQGDMHLIRQSEEPCFKVEPVKKGGVVYERRVARADHPVSKLAPGDETLLDRLDRNLFEQSLDYLAAIHSRHSISSGYQEALDYCEGQLVQSGYMVQRETFAVGTLGRSANLMARKGTGSPVRVIVTAHLDSVNHQGALDSRAPGADDNASGSAGVLALAAALADHWTAGQVLFVLLGGEEQGLFGSRHMVNAPAGFDPDALIVALNMDMIGSINAPANGQPPGLSVLLEAHERSRPLVDQLVTAGHAHTPLKVSVSFNPFASDHVPFIEAGLHAILTIEGEDATNSRIHTADDLPEHVSAELAMAILRMNLGFILEIAEAPGST